MLGQVAPAVEVRVRERSFGPTVFLLSFLGIGLVAVGALGLILVADTVQEAKSAETWARFERWLEGDR